MKGKFVDWGLLLMRIVVAVVFLYHGWGKATQWGIAMDKFVAMGFPGFLGPIVGIAEVVAAVLLLAGLWFKWANIALAVIIAVAMIGVQIPGAVKTGKLLTSGLERDLLIFVSNLVMIGTGPGAFALKLKK